MEFASRSGSLLAVTHSSNDDDIDIDPVDPVLISITGKSGSLEELADGDGDHSDTEDSEKVLFRLRRKINLLTESISSGPTVLVHPAGECQEQCVSSEVDEKDSSNSDTVHPEEVYEYISFEVSDDDDFEELLEDPLQLKKDDIPTSTAKDSSKPKPKSLSKQCHFCGKIFGSGYFSKHLSIHNEERPFPCPHPGCDKAFKLKEQMTKHLFRHTGQRPFKCNFPKCSKTFRKVVNLKNHETVHTGERTFKCGFPGCSKAHAMSLKYHERTHAVDLPFKCAFSGCSKAFINGGNLKAHIRTHTGERPFKCNFAGCSKAYSRPGTLTIHERIHSGEKLFKCDFPGCSKAFIQQGNLKSHTFVHAKEKPFKCSFPGCSKAFTEKGYLKIHARFHTGEKPFQCKVAGCCKAFAQKGNLRTHEKMHTTRPFKCPCGKYFESQRSLKKHQNQRKCSKNK